MAKSKSIASGEERKDLLTALESMRTATRLMRAAQNMFGDIQTSADHIDTVDALEIVLAAKRSLRDALDGFGKWDDLSDTSQKIGSGLYCVWDATIVLLCVLKSPKLPDGEGITSCPVEGTLNVIADQMKRIEADMLRAMKQETARAAA